MTAKTKNLILAAMASVYAAYSAPAHSAGYEYVGLGCIIAANPACQTAGNFTVKTCFEARFKPANVLGNDNNTRLSIFFPQYALNYQQVGSAIGATFKTTRFSYVGSGGGVSDTSQTKWRISVAQPANFSLPSLHLVVDFQRFSDWQSAVCNLSLRFTGQKVPAP